MAKHIWVRLQKYLNIPSAWLCKVLPLYKSACLCTSLIVSGLTGVVRVLYVCMRVRSELERQVFFLPCFLVSHGGEKKIVEQVRSFPPSGQKKNKKLPKSRPQLPSLSASFRRFLITRLRLRSVPRPVFTLIRTALLCVSTTFFGSRYSLRRLMFADSPHTSETTDNSPTTVPPASLVSVFFFVVWRIKNCLRPCSALTSRAVLSFWGPCCSIHPKPLCGGDPHAVLAMFVFSLMYLVTFLRRVCVRGNDVWQTKFIFGVFSSSEQYFLCLIKYVFWLAPIGFMVLILTEEESEEDESRFVKLQPFKKKKKNLWSVPVWILWITRLAVGGLH